ncbi:hypothetical protein ACVXG9_23170 [Escherichia coli]
MYWRVNCDPQICVYAELHRLSGKWRGYVYLKNAGSRPLAFLSGWASFWANDARHCRLWRWRLSAILAF